jgi:hypothetical protein
MKTALAIMLWVSLSFAAQNEFKMQEMPGEVPDLPLFTSPDCNKSISTSVAGQISRYTCGDNTLIRLITIVGSRHIIVSWLFEGSHLIFSEKQWHGGYAEINELEQVFLEKDKLVSWYNSNQKWKIVPDSVYTRLNHDIVAYASKLLKP